MEIVTVLGMPLEHRGRLYNVAVVVDHGSIRGVVPKTFLPNYGEFYEARQFSPGIGEISWHMFENGEMVPFGSNQVFVDYVREELCFAVEICEDLWMPNPPSTKLVSSNAMLVINLSASNELTEKRSTGVNSLRGSRRERFAPICMPMPERENQRRIWYMPDTI